MMEVGKHFQNQIKFYRHIKVTRKQRQIGGKQCPRKGATSQHITTSETEQQHFFLNTQNQNKAIRTPRRQAERLLVERYGGCALCNPGNLSCIPGHM